VSVSPVPVEGADRGGAAKRPRSRRLGGIEALFLAAETESTLFHVASLLLLAPSESGRGVTDRTEVNPAELAALLGERFSSEAVLRQRVIEVPLGLHRPLLVEDPDFTVERHIHRVALAGPTPEAELEAVIGEIMSVPLDRGRPLWDVTIFEGLSDGGLAVLARAHHAIVDGLAGSALLESLLSEKVGSSIRGPTTTGPTTTGPTTTGPTTTGPTTTDSDDRVARRARASGKEQGERVSQEPQPSDSVGAGGGLPDGGELLWTALRELPAEPLELLLAAGRILEALFAVGEQNERDCRLPPPAPFAAPMSALNGSIGGGRLTQFCVLRLERVRAVAQAAGCTVNEVILSIAAGALRRYLGITEGITFPSLVAFVPVAPRDRPTGLQGANTLSGMLVDLATDVADPLARLEAVRTNSQRAKVQAERIGASTLSDWTNHVIPGLFGLVSGLATTMRLFDHVRPPFNVVISNFPGPPAPLSLSGLAVRRVLPLGAIVEGVGLNITVTSYGDELGIGILVSKELLPDAGRLPALIVEALDELVELAVVGSRCGRALDVRRVDDCEG